MAEKMNVKERLKDITDSIEQGIKELFESDKYKQYLSTMSRFHSYSVNNQMLIYMQKPDATHVAGFNKWHDQFERNVNKGERGIKIIAPTPFKKKIEEEKIDPDTKQPMLDENGNVIIEEKTIQIPMFKPVTVFDVSQTSGKPLPELASTLVGDVKNYDVFMEAVKRASSVPIEFQTLAPNLDGYFSESDQKITLREGMSEIQTVCAAIHEMAHSKLHNSQAKEDKLEEIEVCGKKALFSNGRINDDDLPDGLYRYDLRGSDYDPGLPLNIEPNVTVNHAGSIITAEPLDFGEKGFLSVEENLNFLGTAQCIKEYYAEQYPDKVKLSRNTEEVQAESISYAVCAYYGIETSENSFGYIASWSKGKELPELRASLETINKTASSMITDIDKAYAEICKERGITQTANNIEEGMLPADERLFTVDGKYLHVQRTDDDGIDYTIYDMTTKKEIDGGQLDTHFDLLSQAAYEICKLHGIDEKAPLQFTDTDILDSLISASAVITDLPDQNVTIAKMQAYGYTSDTMLPLSKEMAVELFDKGYPVYLLYEDNSEGMVIDRDEIFNHEGMFGIENEDWQRYSIAPSEYEKQFTETKDNSFLILQLKNTPETAKLMFMDTEYLDKQHIPIEYGNYEAVYYGKLDTDSKGNELLEDLYRKFNIDHPEDFTGHSMSVSDILVLKRNNMVSCHYVDSFGFKQLSDFLPENYLKNAEMALEDDFGMIDGIINNGEKNTEEKREPASVLEKLKQPLPEPKTKKTEKSKEMEL